MSGFVATVPSSAQAEGVIANDGWYPDVDLDALRNATRIAGEITTPRLRAAALAAMIAVHRDLAAWRIDQEASGYTSMATVPAQTLDNTSRLVLLYLRAVYSATKADLIERYRDIDLTGSGERRAQDLGPSIDEQRRNARWAVRDIMGLPHAVVELI